VTRTIRMLGIAFAASTVLSTAAMAQMQGYGSRAPSPSSDETKKSDIKGEQPQNAQRGGATTMIGTRKVKLSAAYAKAYQEAVDAANAKDPTASAKVAALHAAAKTADEHYLAYQVQLKVALAANSEADMATALSGIIATGAAPQDQLPTLHLALGKNPLQPEAVPASDRGVRTGPQAPAGQHRGKRTSRRPASR